MHGRRLTARSNAFGGRRNQVHMQRTPTCEAWRNQMIEEKRWQKRQSCGVPGVSTPEFVAAYYHSIRQYARVRSSTPPSPGLYAGVRIRTAVHLRDQYPGSRIALFARSVPENSVGKYQGSRHHVPWSP
eukprot:1034694-Rhodomonas_salina.1